MENKKNLLIVGGSRGIGKAIADRLKNKYKVIITGRDEYRLQETCKELGEDVSYIQYDLCNVSDIDTMYKKVLDKLDGNILNYIVYSAAIHSIMPIRQYSYEYNLELFNINLFSFVELAKLYAKQKFSVENKGKIIAISTMETELFSSGMSMYTDSKAALEAFCITMAREYSHRNIIINGIRPAFVNTDMSGNSLNILPEIKTKYPFGILEADDITKTVQFLLSENAENITGQFININNGYFAR